ncbi:MAG: hypothetical protein ACRD5M_02710 [Candidatus Acidiferrales bacterium]
MKISLGITLFILIFLCVAGCKKADEPATSNPARGAIPSNTGPANPSSPPPAASASDEDGVKAAIERHLRETSGLNLAAMDTAVNSISIQGDKAQANLTFQAKQGGNPMVMVYSLARHGSDWVVVSSQPAGGQFAHPPLDKTHSGMAGNAQPSGTPDLRRFYKDDSSSAHSGAPPAADNSPKN